MCNYGFMVKASRRENMALKEGEQLSKYGFTVRASRWINMALW